MFRRVSYQKGKQTIYFRISFAQKSNSILHVRKSDSTLHVRERVVSIG